MPEEIMTSQPQNAGSKTNLLIVGAIVLLLIVGAVVFSRNQANKMRGTTETQNTQMEATTNPATTEMVDEDANLIDGGMALDDSSSSGDAAVSGMVEEGEVRIIEVEAGAFYYKPASITVKKGEKVKIVMTSKDMMHDFVVDELGIKAPVTKAGETNTFEFTATETGTFQYYCSVGQHKANGQVGTLIVQ